MYLGSRRKSRRLAPDCTAISTGTGIGTAYHLDVASGALIAAGSARVITVIGDDDGRDARGGHDARGAHDVLFLYSRKSP